MSAKFVESMPPPDETAQIDQAQSGNQAAIRAIVRRHNQRLYRLARSIVRDDSEAEDVVQEAYIRAFTHLADFRRDSSLGTWLARIVVNEALGRLRRRRTTVPLTSLDPQGRPGADIIAFPSRDPDPERTMAQHEILRMLEIAIDALPQPFRVVLVARMVEELSIEETADLFGLRPETVKTRLHRARKMLRDGLEQQLGPVLTDTFPFAGARCDRMTEVVLRRLAQSMELR